MLLVELNLSVGKGEEGEVVSAPDVAAGMIFSAALSEDYITR